SGLCRGFHAGGGHAGSFAAENAKGPWSLGCAASCPVHSQKPDNLLCRLRARRNPRMIKRTSVFALLVLATTIPTLAQDQKPAPTLKSVLLQQLRDTHTNSNWFVCAKVAVAGVTPEQANWTDGKG